MTPEERAAKIARLEKIDKLESMDQAAVDPNQPGVEAIGSNESPSLTRQALGVGATGLQTAGKVLDVPRGVITGPLLAEALQKLTGKQVATTEEWQNAVNPTNLKTFPSASELYKRAGVPEGAKMSDYIKYAPKNSPWYMPEEGGMLDFTVRGGAGLGTDIAIDPLTYLSLGASAAAKQGVKAGVAKQAAEALAKKNAGVIGKTVRGVSGAAENVGDVLTAIPQVMAENVAQKPGGAALISMATAPSKAVGWVGKKMYNQPLLGLEHEGMKYGKSEIGQTLYDLGIKSPQNLVEKTAESTNAIMGARDKILQQATAKGAEVDINAAMAPAQNLVDKLKSRANPEQTKAIKMLQQRINKYRAVAAQEPEMVLRELPYTTVEKVPVPQAPLAGYKTAEEKAAADLAGMTSVPETAKGQMLYGPKDVNGRPVAPASAMEAVLESGKPTTEMQTSLKGWKPVTGDEIIGLPQANKISEVVAPKVTTVIEEGVKVKGPTGADIVVDRIRGPNPIQTSAWKSSAANTVGKKGWETLSTAPEGKAFEKALSHGLRKETENAVAKSLGPAAAGDLAELNAEAGKLLATRNAQMQAQKQAERLTAGPTGTTKVIGAVKGPAAATLDMLGNLIKAGQMTGGYYLRKGAENRLTGPMLDAYLRRKYIQGTQPEEK